MATRNSNAVNPTHTTLQEVVRIPRVRRLRYLGSVLTVAPASGFTLDSARQAILTVVVELDSAKAAALGRKAPKPPKGAQLAQQCIQMLSRLGLIERAGDVFRPTSRGSDVATQVTKNDLSAFFELLWTVFPNFRRLLRLVCARKSPLSLPVDRYGGNFERHAREQGIDLDQMSFEIIRDLATELRVFNWRPVPVEGRQYQLVYSTGILDDDPGDPVKALYRVCGTDNKTWSFNPYTIELDHFEQEVWRHYMALTDRVPRFPVLYTDLRDSLCEQLAISDDVFDRSIATLIQAPRRLDIFPAEGILDYSEKLTITYKQVPPRTPHGQYMTFLKLDRRRTT